MKTCFVLVAAPFLLANCAAPLGKGQNFLEISATRGDTSRVDLALETALFDFVGDAGDLTGSQPETEQPQTDGDGSPLDVLTGDDDDDTVIDLDVTQKLEITAGREIRLNRSFDFTYSAALSYSESTYLLPEGAGVLTEPIQIDFATKAVSLQSYVGWRILKRRKYSPRVELGGGIQAGRTRTRARSPILAIDHDSTHTDEFLLLGLRQPFPIPGTDLTGSVGAQAKVFAEDRFGYVWGLNLRY